MSLITIFSDHVLNQKSLKEYIEIRKTLHERGEFNDQKLTQAEENLQRLKREDPNLYEAFYNVLREIYKRDDGCMVEYPINFIREINKIYHGHNNPQKVYETYRLTLEHHCQDT